MHTQEGINAFGCTDWFTAGANACCNGKKVPRGEG